MGQGGHVGIWQAGASRITGSRDPVTAPRRRTTRGRPVAAAGVTATSVTLPPTIHAGRFPSPVFDLPGTASKGLTIAEASNLTAYLCGIPLNDVQWSLAQVNKLLFVRELHRTGRIGEDGVSPAALTNDLPTA